MGDEEDAAELLAVEGAEPGLAQAGGQDDEAGAVTGFSGGGQVGAADQGRAAAVGACDEGIEVRDAGDEGEGTELALAVVGSLGDDEAHAAGGIGHVAGVPGNEV